MRYYIGYTWRGQLPINTTTQVTSPADIRSSCHNGLHTHIHSRQLWVPAPRPSQEHVCADPCSCRVSMLKFAARPASDCPATLHINDPCAGSPKKTLLYIIYMEGATSNYLTIGLEYFHLAYFFPQLIMLNL